MQVLTEEYIRSLIAKNNGRGIYLEGISNKDYHEGPGYSSSNIKTVINETIAKLLHEKANPKEPTPALRLGTAIHCWLLEKEDFWKRYYKEDQVPKAPARNKKEGKDLYVKWEEEHLDKFAKEYGGVTLDGEQWGKEYVLWKHPAFAHMQLITNDEMTILLGIEASFKAHPEIQELFSPEHGKNEIALYWIDKVTGLLCKCRPDRINFAWPCLLDIKSCQSAGLDEFEGDITIHDYHVSAWWYLWGALEVFGKDFEQFVYVPCEKTPPYQVSFHPADAGSLALGEGLARAGLQILKRYEDAKKAGKEFWISHSREVKPAGVRPWAFNKLSQVINKHDLQGLGLEQYVGVV